MIEGRAIKFRAWDKQFKVMCEVAAFWWDTDAGKLRQIELHHEQVSRNLIIEGKIESEIALMQFTGLLDKNGKEIWEGDILQVKQLYDDLVGQVLWGVYKTSINSWDLGETWLIRFAKTPSGIFEAPLYLYCHDYYLRASIIGNIYEHPELIQQKDDSTT